MNAENVPSNFASAAAATSISAYSDEYLGVCSENSARISSQSCSSRRPSLSPERRSSSTQLYSENANIERHGYWTNAKLTIAILMQFCSYANVLQWVRYSPICLNSLLQISQCAAAASVCVLICRGRLWRANSFWHIEHSTRFLCPLCTFFSCDCMLYFFVKRFLHPGHVQAKG